MYVVELRTSRLDRCNNSLEKVMVLAWVEVRQKAEKSFTVIIECFAVVRRIIQASVPPGERNKAKQTKQPSSLEAKRAEVRWELDWVYASAWTQHGILRTA